METKQIFKLIESTVWDLLSKTNAEASISFIQGDYILAINNIVKSGDGNIYIANGSIVKKVDLNDDLDNGEFNLINKNHNYSDTSGDCEIDIYQKIFVYSIPNDLTIIDLKAELKAKVYLHEQNEHLAVETFDVRVKEELAIHNKNK